MVEERRKKISKERMFFLSFSPRLLSLCWIVLFDLECSERRALCNISSTHMAVCVTAKHMGGRGSSGGGGGGGAVVRGGGAGQTRQEGGSGSRLSRWM